MTPGAVKTTSVSAPTPTVMTLSGNEREERRPLGWLHMVDGRFAALLTDRLQNIERYVNEGLEWLQGVRQQQQPPRQKPRQKKKQQQEPEPDQGERSEGDREIVNEICASAGLPTSTSASRGRRRRGRPGKDAASTVDVTGRISGAINPVNDEIPSAIRENQPRREAETGTETETETEESQGTNITMTIKATPLRPPPSSLTVPDSVTAPRIIRTGDADATTSMLVTTATKRKRGRPPKAVSDIETSTTRTTPMPAARATNDGRMKTPLIGGGTLRKRSQAKAAVVATPPTVAAAKRSRPREGTPGPDLSSIGSPLKTPAPVNYTRQPPVQASTLPPIIPPTAAIENDNTSTKIEAWTSKFVVRNSGAPSSLVTAAAVAVPDARNLAVINTDMPVHRTLPIVEIPLPLPPSGEHEPGEANPRSTPTTTLPPILTTAATPIRTVPPPDVTAVEFVPPPTVTRRMASVRHQLPNLHPHNSHNFHKPQQQPPSLPQGGRTDGIPADYAESPLTRARRIDAQNTWREAQLKTFLAAKADMVKMALGSLRSGGREREEAQLQGQGPTPTQAQATNQEQQVDRASDAEQGVEGEREGEERGKVKRGNTLKASPLPSPASASKISPRSGKGGAPEETVSISASVPAVDPEIIARLPALKVIDESDDSHKCAFIAEEQPPLTTSTVAAGALNDDLIFDFDPSSMIRPASHSPIAAVAAASPSSSTRRGGSSGRGLPNLPSTESLPGPTMMIAMDGGEAERRRRLKERNERAVEKKKLLLQKAQQIRSQTVANLSGKPKELPSGRRAVGASTSVSASTSAATLGKSANGAGTSTIKTSTTSSSASTASTVSLQKQAMINSIIAQSKSTAAEAGKGEEITVTTPQKSEGIFKMPLPKVKTPGSATRGGSGDHPSSDDTFTTSAAVISTKTALPPSTTMDMAATVTTAAVSSPKLPQIVDSSEEEVEDELASRGGPHQGRENRPPWANTPEVSKSLLQQRSIRPEDIFGEVEPVKLEDFFKGSGKKYTRGRTSSVWHS